MGVRAALAVLLLLIPTVMAAAGGVTFWRDKFEMTCPEVGTWFEKDKDTGKTQEKYEITYDNNKKHQYSCQYDIDELTKVKYYFYVQGKVCENCFELDNTVFCLAVVMDVLGTTILMVIIFKCSKKKSSAGLHASKAPAHSGGRAVPGSSSEYQELNTHTRSQDPYSEVNRMG